MQNLCVFGGFAKGLYDTMDRVTNIAWRTTSGATLGGFVYEYDALGRITSRSFALGDPSQPSQMSQSSEKTYAYNAKGAWPHLNRIKATIEAIGLFMKEKLR